MSTKEGFARKPHEEGCVTGARKGGAELYPCFGNEGIAGAIHPERVKFHQYMSAKQWEVVITNICQLVGDRRGKGRG